MAGNLRRNISMARQKILTPNVLNKVKLFARQLDNAGVKFDKLIVFGSQVKGTAKPWSDIDLCVVSESFTDEKEDYLVKLINITDEQTDDIEPHPYTPRDLAEKWDPLAHEIRKTGIVVKI